MKQIRQTHVTIRGNTYNFVQKDRILKGRLKMRAGDIFREQVLCDGDNHTQRIFLIPLRLIRGKAVITFDLEKTLCTCSKDS